MNQKIATQELKLGMFVAELDRPWELAPFEPPFQLQGFTVQTDEEIEKVKGLCDYVYIDPELGERAERYLHDGRNLSSTVKGLAQAPPPEHEPVYPDRVTVEEEMVQAREILEDTRTVYRKIEEDIKAGKAVEPKSVQKVVSSLVESIVRNPDAVMWLAQLKKRHETTYEHSMSVSILALTFGRFLGLPEDELNTLGAAALLQDIGKVTLPVELLNKAGKLSVRERELLNKHVDASVAMLSLKKEFPREVIAIVHAHHERYDGSGYPKGLKKSQISLLATVAGMVDTYEAMTSDRPYREAYTSFDALMWIYEQRDAQFPGAIVEQFIQCVGIFPVGSFVALTSGHIGIVVSRNRIHQLKPKVMVLTDAQGKRRRKPRTVDLATQSVPPGEIPILISKVVDAQEHNLDPAEFFL